MSRQNIPTKVCIIELTKMRKLPTMQNFIQGYYWRQNELKVDKGPNFKPTVYDFANFSEEDIRKTWNFANLGNTLLSSRRTKEKIKYSINALSSLKAEPKERCQSLNYLQIMKSNAMKCLIFAHANTNPPLTIPSMKKIFPALISGERKLFDLYPCLQELIQES